MKLFESKRAVLYIRVSTLMQAEEGYSLEAQEHTLKKYCSSKNYTIQDIYLDGGISAKDIDHRPSLNKLLEDIKQRNIDIIVIWALSRLTRSVMDLYYITTLCQQYNVGIVSITEPFDTTTPIGRAIMGILGVFAQMEREITSERVKLALLERAEQGKRTATDVIGYDIKGNDSFTVNHAEAEYVKFCFTEYAKRKNLTEVAEACRQRDYRGKRGKLPTPFSIQKIITNPLYCGYNTFNKKLYKGGHEPIVSFELYERCARILKQQGKLYGRHKSAYNIIIKASEV